MLHVDWVFVLTSSTLSCYNWESHPLSQSWSATSNLKWLYCRTCVVRLKEVLVDMPMGYKMWIGLGSSFSNIIRHLGHSQSMSGVNRYLVWWRPIGFVKSPVELGKWRIWNGWFIKKKKKKKNRISTINIWGGGFLPRWIVKQADFIQFDSSRVRISSGAIDDMADFRIYAK